MQDVQLGERGQALAAISNAINKIHSDSYGRGASSARTIMQDDYVICFMNDIYTPIERTFIEAGRFEQVRQTRLEFQMLMRDRFSEAVEQATGRRVIAFFSQVHNDPDISVEGFVLEPQATNGRPEKD